MKKANASRMPAEAKANHTSFADTPKTKKPILKKSTGQEKAKKQGIQKGRTPFKKNHIPKAGTRPSGP